MNSVLYEQIAPEILQAIGAQAAAYGLSVNDYLRNLLGLYAAKSWAFYAPGVIVAEVLFVLCRKNPSDGILTAIAYDEGVEMLKDQIAVILPSPDGDAALIQQAKEIQSGYSCLHSADC